jgi:3-oxoacyl-[acyl-carrier-protein] synthase III
MIGIKEIASYFPEQQVSNVDRAEETGKSVEFIVDKVGLTSLLRKHEEEDTSDINQQEIDCPIVATQNPDGFGCPTHQRLRNISWACPKTSRPSTCLWGAPGSCKHWNLYSPL